MTVRSEYLNSAANALILCGRWFQQGVGAGGPDERAIGRKCGH
jgi:hypothetical protein